MLLLCSVLTAAGASSPHCRPPCVVSVRKSRPRSKYLLEKTSKKTHLSTMNGTWAASHPLLRSLLGAENRKGAQWVLSSNCTWAGQASPRGGLCPGSAGQAGSPGWYTVFGPGSKEGLPQEEQHGSPWLSGRWSNVVSAVLEGTGKAMGAGGE